MASITFTIPDDQTDRVINTFATYHAYQDTVANPGHNPADPESEETIPNPMSKAQFLKAKIVKFVLDAVRAQEQSVAILAAKAAVVDVPGVE